VPALPSRSHYVFVSHRSTAEHVQVSHDAALGEPVAETAEGILAARPVEQRRRVGHAASIS
jgi:hypothetical protein